MKAISRKGMAARILLAGAVAACCAPVGAFATEQVQGCGDAASTAETQEVSSSFDSQIGLSAAHWSEVPSIAAALDKLNSGETAEDSLASFRNLFQAVHSCGSELLDPYEGGAPVLQDDGHHSRIGAEVLAGARDVLDAAKAATDVDTATAYYEQSEAVICAVNAALCSAEAATDADALKLRWDKRALKKVATKFEKTVGLSKGAKATTKARSVFVAAPLSKSGAFATFSKKSGSPNITVSKNGKCTLKKGTKKGTYTARILVAYSKNTQKTVKVSFVVK